MRPLIRTSAGRYGFRGQQGCKPPKHCPQQARTTVISSSSVKRSSRAGVMGSWWCQRLHLEVAFRACAPHARSSPPTLSRPRAALASEPWIRPPSIPQRRETPVRPLTTHLALQNGLGKGHLIMQAGAQCGYLRRRNWTPSFNRTAALKMPYDAILTDGRPAYGRDIGVLPSSKGQTW